MSTEATPENVLGDYEFQAWITRLRSAPVKEVACGDFGEAYEVNCARVLKLENGKYALITESGCSCYEAQMADIELFPTKKAAMEQFRAWERQNKREDHGL